MSATKQALPADARQALDQAINWTLADKRGVYVVVRLLDGSPAVLSMDESYGRYFASIQSEYARVEWRDGAVVVTIGEGWRA